MKYFFVAMLPLIISCSSLEETHHDPDNTNSSVLDYELGLILTGPTLIISCHYDDCGEWGGHREEIQLIKSNQESFCIAYQQYTVNCDSLTEIFDGVAFYHGFKQVLVRDESVTAEADLKKYIRNFANEMMRSKFEDDHYFSHAGVITSIANRDSSLFIQTYGNKAENFNRLKQKLGFD